MIKRIMGKILGNSGKNNRQNFEHNRLRPITRLLLIFIKICCGYGLLFKLRHSYCFIIFIIHWLTICFHGPTNDNSKHHILKLKISYNYNYSYKPSSQFGNSKLKMYDYLTWLRETENNFLQTQIALFNSDTYDTGKRRVEDGKLHSQLEWAKLSILVYFLAKLTMRLALFAANGAKVCTMYQATPRIFIVSHFLPACKFSSHMVIHYWP